MNKLLTKTNVTVTSIILAITSIAWDHIGNVKLCGMDTFGHWFFVEVLNRSCLNILWNIETALLFPSLSLALLSLITYKCRDEIFTTWVSFAKWWVPLSMLAILIAPEEITGSISVPIKWPLAVFCSVAFFVISLIIIGWKWFSLRKK